MINQLTLMDLDYFLRDTISSIRTHESNRKLISWYKTDKQKENRLKYLRALKTRIKAQIKEQEIE